MVVQAVNSLPPVNPVAPLDPAGSVSKSASGNGGAAFQAVFDAAIQGVQNAQTSAASAVSSVLEGKGGELHSAILSTQRAELEFQLLLEYRNKVVNAYQEVMKIQL
jgi:flagellar hook-basal body complex protein FliE